MISRIRRFLSSVFRRDDRRFPADDVQATAEARIRLRIMVGFNA